VPIASVGAIVLCGGQSTRMGADKAALRIGGESLLARMVRIVSDVLDPVVVAARPGQEIPELPDGVLIAYDAVERAGPLAGIAAGLEALDGRCDACFVCACDHPLLRPAFIRRLIEGLGDATAAVPERDGRRYPLTAVYRVSVRSVIDDLLSSGDRRAGMLADACGARTIPAARFADVDPELDSLLNVNEPEEFDAIAGRL
jgi:molybdopterin-guanine dinucleotide biosynthesis protein A